MPSMIDSLVVGLGLDLKQFNEGRKQASAAFKQTGEDARKQAQQVEAYGKQAAAFFTRMRNEALSFFAVFTAGVGLKNFVSDTITGTASLGRMAANLKMSTQELAAWQRANERAGGTAEGIVAQLRESATEAAKYTSGMTPNNISAFAKYGGNFDAFKDGNAYLRERARIVSELYAKSPARAALAAQELGIQEDTYNLIKQGPQAIEALLAAQRKNAVVTAKDAEEADKLRIRLLDLRDSLQATATKILLTLSPVLTDLIKKLQQAADWVAEHREEIAAWVTDFVSGFLKVSKAVNEAVDAVGGWKVVIGGLLALKVVGITAQLLSLASAVGVLGTATRGFAMSAAFSGLLKSLGIGVALAAHSEGLNVGEAEELARRRALGGPVRDDTGKETMEQFRARVGAGNGDANQAMDSLMAKGWTRAQAAGIVANLKQESNFNPGAVGDGGKAYGIAQWHPDRQAAFKAKYGKDIRGSTFEEQLAFLDWEMREGREKAAGDRLKQATNASEAGAVMSKYNLRPADQIGEMSRRARMAQAFDAADQARTAQALAGTANAARSAGAGRGFLSRGGSNSSSEINIDTINVQTQATDADGIAASIGPAIKRNGLVTQANAGLS